MIFFEKPKFGKTEEETELSAEKKERKMSEAESEQMLDEMNNYVNGLKEILAEKETALKQESDPIKIEELRNEIEELSEQIAGLEEFSEAGKEEGVEFFEENKK